MGINSATRAIAVISCAFVWALAGQAQTGTQIDLHSQTRRVDFTNADFTRPLKMGTVLPVTCSAGDLFFKSDAPAGSNLFGCAGANTWSVQGSASLQLDSDNTRVGARPAENLTPGIGIINTLIDNGSTITLQLSIDSAVVETRATQQAGTSLFCQSASASATAYTCSMNPTLTAYSPGMVLHWLPDVAGAGGPGTLNIDGIGATPLKMSDGTDPALGGIVAGALYSLWFDGTVFRMQAGGASGPSGIVAAPGFYLCPAAGCSSDTSGAFWVAGANLVVDECYGTLGTPPTGSSVIMDVQDATGASIFSGAKIVIAVGATAPVFQSAFTSSPYVVAKGGRLRGAVTVNDSGLSAQDGSLACRVHLQ